MQVTAWDSNNFNKTIQYKMRRENNSAFFYFCTHRLSQFLKLGKYTLKIIFKTRIMSIRRIKRTQTQQRLA